MDYLKELQQTAQDLGIQDHITFLGHRSDLVHFYNLASVVCHLSTKPEPFGRVLTEALATQTPVVAFDQGGASESLHACFPDGLVQPNDIDGFVAALVRHLDFTGSIAIPDEFLLATQVEKTLAVYQELLTDKAISKEATL